MPRLMHATHEVTADGWRCALCKATPSDWLKWELRCTGPDQAAATTVVECQEDPLIIDYTLLDPEGR